MFVYIHSSKQLRQIPYSPSYSYYVVGDLTSRKEDVKFLGLNTIDIQEDLHMYDLAFSELNKLSKANNKEKEIYIVSTSLQSIHDVLSYINIEKDLDSLSYVRIHNSASDKHDLLTFIISDNTVKLLNVYYSQRKFTLPLRFQIDMIHSMLTSRNVQCPDTEEKILPYKNVLDYTQLVQLLKSYVNDNGYLYWIPNEGNGGDAFIALGTIHFLKRHQIPYRIISDYSVIREGDKLVYSGGGNLVSHYPQCEHFLKRYAPSNNILILPHTIDKTDVLESLPSNVTIVARDVTSYYICKQHCNNGNNIYLHHDMAFYLDVSKTKFRYSIDDKKLHTLNCFRNDVERTIMNVHKNIDLPEYINHDRYMVNEEKIERTVVDILDVLSKYEIVNTNRLHMCIASHLLGNIRVNFFNNSYWKNREVYKHSPLINNRLISFNG